MTDQLDIDARIGGLLQAELPVPEHGDGYRERVAALLTAEAVAGAGRRTWLPEWRWPLRKPAEEQHSLRRVARAKPRRTRTAFVLGSAVVIVVVLAVATLAVVRQLGEPEMVLRITDASDVSGAGAAGPGEVVATTLVSLDETKALIQDLLKAINAGDPAAVRKFYLTNGWLENDVGAAKIQGSVGISEYWQTARDSRGMRIEAVGDPIPHDRYVLQRVNYVLSDGAGTIPGIQVYQIDTDGLIAHEWLTGWLEGE